MFHRGISAEPVDMTLKHLWLSVSFVCRVVVASA